jgi:hypothetical protein
VSTDWNAEELWIFLDDYVVSTNAFQVSATPYGPWRNFTAPWAPRAAAAFTTHWNASVAYFGSGMTFKDGDLDPQGPVFGDAWMIDTSVCLLGGNSKPCSGNGVADLDAVVCRCFSGFSGLYCDVGSAAAGAAAGVLGTSPAALGGSIGAILLAVAALLAYQRWWAGTVPIVDRAIDAVQDVAQDMARRARSISGGSSTGSAFLPRPASSAGGAGASPQGSPGAYGSL